MIDYTIDPFTETKINLDNIMSPPFFNTTYNVGPKGGSTDKYTKVKQYVFNEHLKALNNHPISRNWDEARKVQLATFLTAHKIFENGWVTGPGKDWAGY